MDCLLYAFLICMKSTMPFFPFNFVFGKKLFEILGSVSSVKLIKIIIEFVIMVEGATCMLFW